MTITSFTSVPFTDPSISDLVLKINDLCRCNNNLSMIRCWANTDDREDLCWCFGRLSMIRVGPGIGN